MPEHKKAPETADNVCFRAFLFQQHQMLRWKIQIFRKIFIRILRKAVFGTHPPSSGSILFRFVPDHILMFKCSFYVLFYPHCHTVLTRL